LVIYQESVSCLIPRGILGFVGFTGYVLNVIMCLKRFRTDSLLHGCW